MRVVKQTSDAEITDSFSSEDEKFHVVHGKNEGCWFKHVTFFLN